MHVRVDRKPPVAYTGATMADKESQKAKLAFLSSDFTISIRDPLWKDIMLSPQFAKLYHLPAVQKLGRIKQLGPAFHIYPGAVHTRLDHSLGVYHVARLMLVSLLRSGQGQGLITRKGMLSFLAAAMLHDLGHFPYAHSLKELPLQEHEHLATTIIQNDDSIKEALNDAGCDIYQVCAIIDDTLPGNSLETNLYRAMLSGTLDPDKLDYLSRDAFFCGVPYGVQDASYIIDQLRLAEMRPAVSSHALGSVEHLLFSKYLMYQNVYWHKGTRAATAMIKKAMLTALRDGAIRPQDLYGMDDEQFFLLPQRIDFPSLALVDNVRDNQLLACRYETGYSEDSPLHRTAKRLDTRLECEERLYLALLPEYPDIKSWEVIVDIPEPISFESDIPIVSDDGTIRPFNTADELFSGPVVDAFARTLRKIRVFVPPQVRSGDVETAIRSTIG